MIPASQPLTRRFSASLERGVLASVTCNGLLTVWFYAVVAHTHDIRARIPIVVGVLYPFGGLTILALMSVIGLCAASFIGGLNRSAVAGAVLGAAGTFTLIASGLIARWIPARYDSPPRYWLLVLAIVVAALVLWLVDRRAHGATRASGPPD